MNPFAFLIDILLQMYAMILLLRVILQWVRADFYNPACQFIVKITNPVVKPVRRFIPGLWGIDMATVLLVLIITAIKLAAVYALSGYSIGIAPLIMGSVLDSIQLLLSIFLYGIIIQALLSWINPDPYNPMMVLLNSITRPVLRPFQRLLPPMGGFDISPIFAIIAIMFIQQSLKYFL